MGVLIFGDLEPDETIRVRFAIDGEYLVNEINERVALGIVRQNAGQVIARIAEPIRTDGAALIGQTDSFCEIANVFQAKAIRDSPHTVVIASGPRGVSSVATSIPEGVFAPPMANGTCTVASI
jgi:hypothetical protein